VVAKHGHGSFGDGNAVLDLPPGPVDAAAIAKALRRDLRCDAPGETVDGCLKSFAAHGGMVEARIAGDAEAARALFERTVAILDEEAGAD
jgi:hypothetical protein